MASEYFSYNSLWQIAVCKECRFAVWPDHITRHLQGKQHGMSRREAQGIADEVQSLGGLAQYPTQFDAPQCITEPIAELPLHEDGLQCRRDPERCRYICRDEKTMKQHWRVEHGWAVQSRRGRVAAGQQQDTQRRFEGAVGRVHCQRMFAQGPHSSYFEVRQPDRAQPDQERIDTSSQATWTRAWERANQRFSKVEAEAEQAIKEGQKDEVNPWLKRTGWVKYLEGCQRDELLQSVQEPDPDAEQEQDQEPVEAVIWEAMEQVGIKSQCSVRDSGVMLRMHAVRTEKDQPRYQPLQPYWDEDSVVHHCRPWQQMLMFFARTQRPHDWSSPRYRFNRRQQAAWDRLSAAAERSVYGMGDEQDNKQDDKFSDCESDAGADQETRHKPRLDAIQSACLDFCIELMNQTVHRKEYDCAMVCAMAVLGVSPFRVGWRDPESYPPILSSVIKIAHFMVVQKAVGMASEGDDSEDEYSPCGSPCTFEVDSGYGSESSQHVPTSPHMPSSPSRTMPSSVGRWFNPIGSANPTSSANPIGGSSPVRNCKRVSSMQWVRFMMDSFMVRRTDSPIDWLLDLRTYGLKIHYNTTAPGHVMWKDGDVLQYKDVSFNMAEFRGTVHQMLGETRRTLLEDVMFTPDANEIPTIPWASLHDDPSNSKVGWSFIDDQRNQFPVDGHSWLFQRVQSLDNVRKRFVVANSTSGVSKERMGDWMRRVVDFRGRLLALMHMTGGQPARGPEILSVRHRNTSQGGHRNLFIEDGLVVFVTRYSKQYMITGDVKIIHRYLPREVGELVVWYLWLVVPFVQRMETMLWGRSPSPSHMWPPDVEGKKWTTERMSGVLKQATTEGMGRVIGVHAYREIAIAISRKCIRGATQFQRDEADANPQWDDENALANAADEQATHTPHIAGSIYARNAMEQSGANADMRMRFRMVSTDWHRFLGFESTRIAEQGLLGKRRCPFDDHAEEQRADRRIRLRQVNASAALKRMMRADVELRSVQGPAIEAIQQGKSPVVAVMPTGSGKSGLFMLPAWVQAGGVTIVVVPLTGLREDMLFRCTELGIKCAVWDDIQQPDAASIVLVTPEKALDEAFRTYVRRIQETRQLDRIVVDECHVILNNQLDFRKRLQRMGELVGAETQMILLTATLPPCKEEMLFERMYWNRSEVHIIRASTVRPNIAYAVVDGGRDQASRDAQLEQLVRNVLEDSSRPNSKVLIMCNSRAGTQRIAESGMFPCEYYHANLPKPRKKELLGDFRDGDFRVIAATGAFGTGIDIGDIHLVVHFDEPWDMLDYGQTSGRGGRDGKPTKAVIIRGGLASDDELMRQYIDSKQRQCRRIMIDRYLDGDIQRFQCMPGEAHCDVCEQRAEQEAVAVEVATQEAASAAREVQDAIVRAHAAAQVAKQLQSAAKARAEGHQDHKPAAAPQASISQASQEREALMQEFADQDRQRKIPQARRVQQAQSHASTQSRVVRRLEQWKSVCVICHAEGKEFHHSISRCPNPNSAIAEAERKVAQRRVQFSRGGTCYKCGVLRSICNRWDGDNPAPLSNEPCQFYGVLFGVVYGFKHAYPQVWQEWSSRVERKGGSVRTEKELWELWGGTRVIDGLDCSGMLWAFCRLTERVGLDRQVRHSVGG